MPEITLVRQHDVQVTEEEKAVARKVMFGIVDGLGEKGQKQWRRFWSSVLRLGPGEMMEVSTRQERVGPYHRRHMLLESRVFEAQEAFDNFNQFRNWLKVGAGHCDWYPSPRGGMFAVPNSIAYSNLEQGAMEEFHSNAVTFLRTPQAWRVLWPHAKHEAAFDRVEMILGAMGE